MFTAENFVQDCLDAVAAVQNGATGFTPDHLIRGEWVIGGVVPSKTLDTRNTGIQATEWFESLSAADRSDVLELLAAGVYGVGSWVDRNGQTVLDVCDTEWRTCDALARAEHREEEAIWHPEHGELDV